MAVRTIIIEEETEDALIKEVERRIRHAGEIGIKVVGTFQFQSSSGEKSFRYALFVEGGCCC